MGEFRKSEGQKIRQKGRWRSSAAPPTDFAPRTCHSAPVDMPSQYKMTGGQSIAGSQGKQRNLAWIAELARLSRPV
jgi:anaerobic ribonucleoside-triphosphate reductase